MTPERWEHIETIYHAALELPGGQRSAYLDQSCAGDDELRREVESLLTAHDQASTFIDRTPDDVVAGMLAEKQSRSMIGRTLGHYRLDSLLGAGGMGEVYRALDTKLDRDVAVKILPEHLADNHEALWRFEREAKAVAALSHPNILSIFDFGTEQGLSYAVTELLEGETLRERLEEAPLGWREAVSFGIDIAEGLAAAHAKRIIHRDIKPGNIFLTSDGQVKILDFGIARVMHEVTPDSKTAASGIETTRPGAVIGTIGYMSPEQVRGEQDDAPSDIFSLGCVLYEMACGRRPFERKTGAETIEAILNDEPVPLSNLDKTAPEELERIINHCLDKNPGRHFQSARDLASDLRAVLGGDKRAISAPVLSRRQTGTAVRLGVVAAIIVLLVVGAWLFWASRQERPIDSLAILPIANASGDANLEYLTDGITESLINSLSQLPQLRVMARGTVFSYKGKEVDPRNVGQE